MLFWWCFLSLGTHDLGQYCLVKKWHVHKWLKLGDTQIQELQEGWATAHHPGSAVFSRPGNSQQRFLQRETNEDHHTKSAFLHPSDCRALMLRSSGSHTTELLYIQYRRQILWWKPHIMLFLWCARFNPPVWKSSNTIITCFPLFIVVCCPQTQWMPAAMSVWRPSYWWVTSGFFFSFKIYAYGCFLSLSHFQLFLFICRLSRIFCQVPNSGWKQLLLIWKHWEWKLMFCVV